MKLFPRATKEQRKNGWTFREPFVAGIYNWLGGYGEGWTFHQIQDVLEAAEKVLAQMEREKRRK